ncbi:MKI67 FHA domain-interacting nucleolar phosphoprotein-like [Argiope bruennichi]|uniref:MKI67 FHA domain-interacting nucleolar like protein n=1 Tax=Argiope bruennichi TaxID=94029 RepID=A0A8T0E757_ARGBR|nr:MKI67 FHA domain-interacting nucleolar phosphoprotein-like [Argiope bruennichi]KAF8767613.1 MKI67 FHA domain-interacting nucleolar like protein [Argiope bruennichi]
MMNAFVENVRRKIKTPNKKSEDKPKKSKKPKKKTVQEDSGPGVIYVGHIPHGFYETEMKAYFSQFGKILRIRVARSRKTGRPKGFAFIEFKSEEIAKIAAEAMNNYLFFEKLLKCEFIPADKVNPNVFKGWKGPLLSSDRNRRVHNRPKTSEEKTKSKDRRMKRLKKLQSFLDKKEIDFKVESVLPEEK